MTIMMGRQQYSQWGREALRQPSQCLDDAIWNQNALVMQSLHEMSWAKPTRLATGAYGTSYWARFGTQMHYWMAPWLSHSFEEEIR